jgi:hypothetical protein
MKGEKDRRDEQMTKPEIRMTNDRPSQTQDWKLTTLEVIALQWK